MDFGSFIHFIEREIFETNSIGIGFSRIFATLYIIHIFENRDTDVTNHSNSGLPGRAFVRSFYYCQY